MEENNNSGVDLETEEDVVILPADSQRQHSSHIEHRYVCATRIGPGRLRSLDRQREWTHDDEMIVDMEENETNRHQERAMRSLTATGTGEVSHT